MGRAALEVCVQLRAAAPAHDERIGAVAVPVGELHGAQRFRTRDAVAKRFLALQAVLAEYLVECISALFEKVLVVCLFYDRECRDHLSWYHVREQFARKGRARHVRAAQLVQGTPCGGEQEISAAGDEAWVAGILGKGQVDDGSSRRRRLAPAFLLDEGIVEYRELAAVNLQLLAATRECEHQPLGPCALHMPHLNTWRAHYEGQWPVAGLPFHRRARDLQVSNGPTLLRLAPQREGDRSAAQHLTPALAGEGVLQFHVAQLRLAVGNQVADDKVALAT